MKTSKWASLISIILVLGVQLHAEKILLTPETAVESALANNISIRQNKITLDSKKREKSSAWGVISPTASISANYSKTLPAVENKKDSISLGASVRTTLTPGIFVQVEKTKIALEQQEISYETAERSIQLAVLQSYYGILYNIENLSLLENSLETKKKQYESNKARYDRGLLSRVDVLSAQITVQNTELNVESQKINLENSIDQFKQVVGIAQEDQVEFSGSFEKYLRLEKIKTEDLEKNSASIAVLEKQLENERNNLLMAKYSAYGPSLSAGYSYSYGSNDGGENWNDGGTLSLGATIPLDGFLPWSKSAQSIEAQKESISTLELRLGNERTSYEIKTRNLVKKINQYIDNIRVRKNSIDLAQTNYTMTIEAYNHGTRDLLTLQAAHDNLMSAKVNLVAEANSLACAIHELEYECGWEFGRLTGDRNEK